MHGRTADTARDLVLYLVTMILSLTVHEFSHAFMADKLGDGTPRTQGRLTLSPLAHYDLFGTIIIPIFGILAHFPFFGWARPVETNPGNYTRKISMRNGHRLVAAAGPLSNLALATLAMGLLTLLVRAVPHLGGGDTMPGAFAALLLALVQVNLGLCVLNFLPIPPLDGSRLLPRSLDGFQRAVAPYSFLILFVLLNAPGLRMVFVRPITFLGGILQVLFGIHVGFA